MGVHLDIRIHQGRWNVQKDRQEEGREKKRVKEEKLKRKREESNILILDSFPGETVVVSVGLRINGIEKGMMDDAPAVWSLVEDPISTPEKYRHLVPLICLRHSTTRKWLSSVLCV